MRFVLDTGSSASWLFARGQNKLSGVGVEVDYTDQGKAALGNTAEAMSSMSCFGPRNTGPDTLAMALLNLWSVHHQSKPELNRVWTDR